MTTALATIADATLKKDIRAAFRQRKWEDTQLRNGVYDEIRPAIRSHMERTLTKSRIWWGIVACSVVPIESRCSGMRCGKSHRTRTCHPYMKIKVHVSRASDGTSRYLNINIRIVEVKAAVQAPPAQIKTQIASDQIKLASSW